MSIGAITVGALKPSWSFEIVYADNTHPDITGATITGAIRVKGTDLVKALTPANFSISEAGSGADNPIVGYAQVAADVDTPGEWEYLVKVTVGGKPQYLRGEFEILPSFGGL